MKDVPYAEASSGAQARNDIIALLRGLGCSGVGFYDDFDAQELHLVFQHRGRQIKLTASARGWAKLYLKQHPWTYRKKSTRENYENAALKQGLLAVNSILRDLIKGQITAIECGILSVEEVFLPHIVGADGRRFIDHALESGLLALPKPDAP